MTSTPLALVEAVISCRPMIEPQIVEQVAYHCSLSREWAKVAAANAITELILRKRIEQFSDNPRAYRITAAVQVEVTADKERKAQQATTKRLRATRAHPIEKLIEQAQEREARGKRERGEAT